MRTLILWALALVSSVYTVGAFRLDFLGPEGAPGPGFFPRIIGIGLLATLALELLPRFRRAGSMPRAPEDTGDSGAHDALKVGLLAVAFVATIPILGTVLAASAFLVAGFRVLQGGTVRAHVTLALLIPALTFLFFDRWLGVPLPVGLLGRLF